MIKLEHVSKAYSAGIPALNDVNLEIDDGEFVFVCGDSGSGKSTLIKLLLKELDPTDGTITVDGRNLTRIRHKQVPKYRRNVGVVFQDFRLLKDRNVYENVAFALKVIGASTAVIKKKVPQMLSMVGLAAKYKSKPRELSGGEQQRAAIAVALANKPDILLADEPTGAVDTRTADTIYELFHKLNKELGITIIIVTHDMALAGRVGRTVLISAGKVSTEKLKKHPAMEYTVLDKAHRIKLTDEMLEAAGIESNKVRVDVQDGKLVISRI